MVLTKGDLTEINKLLGAQTKAIRGEVIDFISDRVLPQIDETNNTVSRIEDRLDKQEDRYFEVSTRVAKLEKIHSIDKHASV